MDTPKSTLIKNLYLYLVCFVALMMVVIATGDVIQIILKKYIFTKADQDYYSYPTSDCGAIMPKGAPPIPAMPEGVKSPTPEECKQRETEARKQSDDNRASQRQRDLVRDISFILVGVPLFVYHWSVVRRKE
ncbi:MAG: hypothetical protein EXS55_03280 [Candidatus Magasanikbacteria bacterium]|nr:hypothetical protein [Candidatus Magasanikbacteria bacterium]